VEQLVAKATGYCVGRPLSQ